SFVAPRYFAIETATLIPRALKLCVGLIDSSLIQSSMSSIPQLRDARSSGVPPSPNETGSTSDGNGKTSRSRHNDFSRPSRVSRVMARLTVARSTIANSGLLQERQRFCSRDHSCLSPHALHSRRFRNMGAIEAYICQDRELL